MQRLEFSPNIKDQVEELIFKGNMNMLPHLQNCVAVCLSAP